MGKIRKTSFPNERRRYPRFDLSLALAYQWGNKKDTLRGGKESHPRRPYGTTHPLFNGQVQRPSYYDQYETDSFQYLEVLQWSSRCRTQRGLSFRKNPHETFCSQRSLFSYSLIFLQSHQLFKRLSLPKEFQNRRLRP